VAKKLVRSWCIQGVGWYALTEIAARVIVEGTFVMVLWWLGAGLLGTFLGWLVFHTAMWFVFYGGFMRMWIVLGFASTLQKLQDHYARLEVRARRQRMFRLVFVRGSTARGEMNARSDIDIMLIPRKGILAKVLGILFLWGLRTESMLRRIPVEARWIDLERYAPYHHIGETPRVLYHDPGPDASALRRLTTRGLLVAFSGIDGSGKTTVARKLVAGLKERGVDAVYLWGHRQAWYTQDAGPNLSFAILFESLWKRIGRKIANLDRHAFAKLVYDIATATDYLYVVWKVAQLRRPNRVVVADRYVADVLAYLRSWAPLKVTVEGLLVGMAPEPDLAILFALDPTTVRERKKENSEAQLRRFGDEYRALVPFLHLVSVDARPPVDEVYAQVRKIVEAQLGLSASSAPQVPKRSKIPAAGASG